MAPVPTRVVVVVAFLTLRLLLLPRLSHLRIVCGFGLLLPVRLCADHFEIILG